MEPLGFKMEKRIERCDAKDLGKRNSGPSADPAEDLFGKIPMFLGFLRLFQDPKQCARSPSVPFNDAVKVRDLRRFHGHGRHTVPLPGRPRRGVARL
jgi:hypothetical protein